MPDSIDVVGRVSSESVQKHTGKTWDQWIKILNAAKAQDWPYKEIIFYLKTKHKLTLWWQGIVTMGYEIHIGRRVQGRNQKGEYAVSLIKTFPIPIESLWKFLASEKGQAVWLKAHSKLIFKKGEVFETENGIFGEVRTLKVAARLRLTWQDSDWEKPSILQLMLIKRPKEKSMLIFQAEKLPSARIRLQMQAHWRKVLEELLENLTSLAIQKSR